jgi:hypothetical protein
MRTSAGQPQNLLESLVVSDLKTVNPHGLLSHFNHISWEKNSVS